ncbi:MAG: hypothetical protein H0V88_14305 [Pyrinomonadaceae bacterium]|nr:hypothetical protein [Pyrinomonadaceae bacterium]
MLMLVAVCPVLIVTAQQQFPANLARPDTKLNPALFPLEDVRAGQKGIARTVFSGSEPEEFGVEILGVLPGFPAPRQSAILARLTGKNVERTGVFAGMSGSPVYIDARLVGAIAFSFPYSKEPIAGITPIKQMIDIFEREGATTLRTASRERAPRSITMRELASTEVKFDLPQGTVASSSFIAPVVGGSPLAALLGQQITSIATPMTFGGISADALARFSPQLQANGILPVSGAGGASPITPLAKTTERTLAPGTSVSVQLVRGDYSIAAAGTVTLRDGERIYAFGHPFLGLGAADMPMSESSVVAVVPSTLNSFKLSVPGQMVGAISQDRSTGIYGQLGHAPRMIPVRLNLRTSRDKNEQFNFEIANDEMLTPLLLNLTVYSAITSTERSLGDATISVHGQINVANQPAIQLERRFSDARAPVLAAGSIAAPVSTLLSSGFKDVKIEGITLNISSDDSKRTATLDRITLDRTEVKRGQTINVQAYLRDDSGKQIIERIPVEIPADVPAGALLLFVGDGASLQQASASQAFVPKNLNDLVNQINEVKKSDRLYVKLYRITQGAVVGSSELPNLPPSVLATLDSDRSSGGFTPTILSPVVERELPPAAYVVAGQQLIQINVVR